MALLDNKEELLRIEQQKDFAVEIMQKNVIAAAFTNDYSRRFCWSNNALEGNTLSLDDTVRLIDYDEVRSGHKYSEYVEAKNVYSAITNMLIPFQTTEIDEQWIQRVNGYVMGTEGEYRKESVYIGSVTEAVFFPPDHERIPELMKNFTETVNIKETSAEHLFSEISRQHIIFERIHPFLDGNGRTGRMILNQQLINNGYLPISITPTGKYRQAFRRYDKNGDISSLTHLLLKSELESFARVFDLNAKYLLDRSGDSVEWEEQRLTSKKKKIEIDY